MCASRSALHCNIAALYCNIAAISLHYTARLHALAGAAFECSEIDARLEDRRSQSTMRTGSSELAGFNDHYNYYCDYCADLRLFVLVCADLRLASKARS